MGFLAKESLSIVKSMLGGSHRANHFFTMLLAKTQIIPLPIVPMSIVSATIPGRSLSEIKFIDAGTTYTIAGDTTFESWEVKIRTFEYLDYRMIKSWFESIHAPMNGSRANPKEYKSICTVSQIDYRTGLPLHNFLLKGVYPKNIGSVQFDEDSSELITFTVTLNIDDIIVL